MTFCDWDELDEMDLMEIKLNVAKCIPDVDMQNLIKMIFTNILIVEYIVILSLN